MDEKLRKLKRAIVDDETAARYVAECVRLGENTRARVKVASQLESPVARLLEPQPIYEGAASISLAVSDLTQEEVDDLLDFLQIEAIAPYVHEQTSHTELHRYLAILRTIDGRTKYNQLYDLEDIGYFGMTMLQRRLLARVLLKLDYKDLFPWVK